MTSKILSPIDRWRPARDVRATADPSPPRLLCVAAHPDDESMAMGGTLARYAAEGVETYVVTATRGERGRYRDNTEHPGPEALGRIREAELRAAARDGFVRGATPWRDWTITTSVDASAWWRVVWRAVRCHTSQIDAFNRLEQSPERVHESVWGSQEYYRALSLVNGGRDLETHLFAGLRDLSIHRDGAEEEPIAA